MGRILAGTARHRNLAANGYASKQSRILAEQLASEIADLQCPESHSAAADWSEILTEKRLSRASPCHNL